MPSLVVVDQGKKTVFALRDGQNLVGRHPDSTIPLVLPSVSGKHAIIHCENGQFFLEDVGSRNGTFLNKQQVKTKVPLKHNDMVQFGDAVAKFEHAEAAAPVAQTAPPAAVAPPAKKSSAPTVDDSLLSKGTVAFTDEAEDEASITGQASNQGRFGVLDTNPEAKLRAVLEISQSLAGTVDLDKLLPQILDSLFGIFKYADRGCILLKDDRTGEMVSRAMKHRRAGEDATVRLSRTIIKKVLTDKCGVMSADASTDASFTGSQSIADLKIRGQIRTEPI